MSHDDLAKKVLPLFEEKSSCAREQVKHAILERRTGLEKIDTAIEQYLSKWNDVTRPGSVALACEAVGGSLEHVVPLQTALLFIAATMDIHDDIIDDSVSKKNKKTIYGRLGTGSTLLIGDALMVRGFHRLDKALVHLPMDRKSSIMDTVDSFLSEVVEAHILESSLKRGKVAPKPNAYLQILNKKGADIEGHMKIGAIFGGGSEKEIQALTKYGRNVGTLLAVRSEFIDVYDPAELIHRVKFEILPLPILYALESDKGKKIRQIVEKESLRIDDCNEILDAMYATKEVANLKNQLLKLKKDAIKSLGYLANKEVKDQLVALASFMLEDL